MLQISELCSDEFAVKLLPIVICTVQTTIKYCTLVHLYELFNVKGGFTQAMKGRQLVLIIQRPSHNQMTALPDNNINFYVEFIAVHVHPVHALPYFFFIFAESLYCNDPYLEDPYQEQSLATILASQDFSSCELDKVFTNSAKIND